MTTEAVLWEWLNAFSDESTRDIAAEGYRRAHSYARIEVVPFEPELIDSVVDLYRMSADSEGCRSAFRTDVDHDSEVMPISVPN